ncbi:MAG TPA: arginine deiminase family protein [Blastocatellia bacterium]|nr:arginine deiminase family protein [Blastocatellia bacterium]
MISAITRAISPSINDCELTFHAKQPIDVARAIKQHQAYEQCLRRLGVRVISLRAEPALPDAVFVEDAAVVVDEIAVIPVMGAESRRPETASISQALKHFRPLEFLRLPATLDGGDVLRIGRKLFVGASRRTNPEGIRQLREILNVYDYEVREVEVPGCLHLKSGCSYIGRNSILVNRALVDATRLEEFDLIEVPDEEAWAANALLINDVVILPESFPKTRALLESAGFHVQPIDVSELQKAEGGVTCTSIIFDAR